MKRTVVFLFALAIAGSTYGKFQPSHDVTSSGGVIEGLVTDGEWPLPGVTITVLAAAGAKPLYAVTDTKGYYELRNLPPGNYTVDIELPGFNRNRVSNVVITATQGASLVTIITAQVISESITVSSVSGMDLDNEPRPQYATIKEHEFIATKDERTTTFAIDVDRASYANVRRFLEDGEVPPPDAVRIEEMVNYFTYAYPQPQGDVPFSITTEVAGTPWNPKTRLLRVGIQGRDLEQWKMAPNNLVFLLDVSGSMDDPDKLPLIQQAFAILVDQLRPEDRVAIVVYAGAAGLVLPSTSGADKERILAAINALDAGGSTAGGEGIELAYKVAKENYLDHGNNRVILATDGDFNVGVTSLSALERLIEKKRRSGIDLSVLGVGTDNLEDALMEMLADKGNGNYAYLDSQKEADKVFKQELTGTLVTIAKDVKVQLEFDPKAVVSYRQIGYENRALDNKDFDDDEKDAGELGAGHSVTALFEIVPAAASNGRIGTLRLRYKEPKGFRSKPLTTEILDDGKSAYDASPDMRLASAVAMFGMLLRDSPHKGASTYDDVLQLAKVAGGADLDGTRRELVKLAETARSLR